MRNKLLASNRVSRKVLRHNNFYEANTTRQNAYEVLLSQAEIDMIINAAEMLGNSGVLGTGNPSAFSLHSVFQCFVRNIYFETELVPKRTKRGGPNCWWGKTHCSNNGECCYKCPETSDCLGLCGPGCRCWPWVCLTAAGTNCATTAISVVLMLHTLSRCIARTHSCPLELLDFVWPHL